MKNSTFNVIMYDVLIQFIFPSGCTSYFSCRITSRRVCDFEDVVFLDIVDLDENPDNSLVLAKLSDEVVKSAGKKSGGFGG